MGGEKKEDGGEGEKEGRKEKTDVTKDFSDLILSMGELRDGGKTVVNGRTKLRELHGSAVDFFFQMFSRLQIDV